MFRFTIRDVLWLTVVVAMAIAWWLNKQSYATTRERTYTTETIIKGKAYKEIHEVRIRWIPKPIN